MRDYKQELADRIAFIQELLRTSGSKGIVFGNSGGKDSALVGILCKMACPNVLGIMMPCQSQTNFTDDLIDGGAVAAQFDIANVTIDLSDVKTALTQAIETAVPLHKRESQMNINPRLRMTTLYAVAQELNYLVAGTGNRSETYMGYFTKWGDGGYDFNPIRDLTVTEVYAFLAYLDAPQSIQQKAPSAGLFAGQTDEAEMGVTYNAIDRYILTGTGEAEDVAIIEGYHRRSAHKRTLPVVFADPQD